MVVKFETLKRRALKLETEPRHVACINDWDVRNVGFLIHVYPGIVPFKYRKSCTVRAYRADNRNLDWMVEIT